MRNIKAIASHNSLPIFSTKKQLSIFEVYIKVESQEQADRLKQVCINNGLPIWKNKIAFEFQNKNNDLFSVGNAETKEFFIFPYKGNESDLYGFEQVTESEFMEILKQYKTNLNI